KIAAVCCARSVVFPPAFYLGDSSDVVLAKVINNLEQVRGELQALGISVVLRPELTGKGSQFGSLDELLVVSAAVEGVLPCIDFGHLHARSGGAFNTYQEFCTVLRCMEERLGRSALENVHFHVSGINYGPKGERNHLLLDESDFNYQDLLRAFKAYAVKGLVICESPNIEEDALRLQACYDALN
ncbi:MAG TPA: TIM barrel protein, partial [Desulfobacteria bacterium]|nr:TIM barrel protein [Desulfobacteria bacterium]